MPIKIDLFNVVPGTIIEVPAGFSNEDGPVTRRIVAKNVLRSHTSEQVCVIPHLDFEEPHIGGFNERVTFIGLDANTGGDDSPVSEINHGEVTVEGWGGERVIALDGVRDTLGDINHTLRESADRDTIDIIEDASRSIMLNIGLTADESADDIAVHNALDILGLVNATALADIVAATRAAYAHAARTSDPHRFQTVGSMIGRARS